MISGKHVVLRARQKDDIPVLHTELYEDVAERLRTDSRPWRPIPEDAPNAPFAYPPSSDTSDVFSVVERASGELAGSASLWSIDLHNRSAHLGISLRPAFRGRGLGTDTLRVLCEFGFRARGLNRLQLETLADNAAMLRSADRLGFVREGTLRRDAWLQGVYIDLAILGLLTEEWAAGA